MTLKFTFILVTLLSFALGESQEEPKDKELISSGKWYLEYISVQSEKVEFTKDLQELNWVVFHTDGNLEVMEMGEKTFGKWEYLKDGRIIRTNDRDGVIDQKIAILTESKLVVTVLESGTEMGMTKM